jgi:hypothetical protein
MSESVLYMSMSLDGYVAGPNDEPGNHDGTRRSETLTAVELRDGWSESLDKLGRHLNRRRGQA